MFFVLMTGSLIGSLDDFRFLRVLGGVLIGLPGIYCILLGYRLLKLFDLFDPIELRSAPD